jgi:glycosyltransferase involved in cell wall biosynthesis
MNRARVLGAPTPPAISIVIPAYNHARFLEDTLRSVQQQSFQDWECVVVDDGSTDGTSAIAQRYAHEDRRIRTVQIDNSGESAARNHGYRLTNPESTLVTFMDSDDVWLPHALATLHARLLADPTAIGAHGLAEDIDETGELRSSRSHSDFGRNRLGLEGRRLIVWPIDRPTTFDVLINGNVLFPPGLLLARRTAYERAGRFDERFTGGADWDMLIRLSRFGYLAFVDEVILHYRRHGSNMGAAPGIERQAWLVRCKGFHSPDNDAPQQRSARRGWRAYQRYMISQRWSSARDDFRAKRLGRAVGQIARIPVHAFRHVRGYPTPKLVRASEPWGPPLRTQGPDAAA